jgi:hypothetical protein
LFGALAVYVRRTRENPTGDVSVTDEPLMDTGTMRSYRTLVGDQESGNAVEIVWALRPVMTWSGKKVVRAPEGGTEAYIDTFVVPRHARRKGTGRQAYEVWEGRLPPEVTVVRLTAQGHSPRFWEKMGFEWRYGTPERLDAESVEMVKGVHGSPTPAMIPLGA